VSVVGVRLGRAEYGLPAAAVREVLRPPPLTRAPFPPPDVRGLAQVRGALLAVLDLGTRLGGSPAAAPGRLVVVDSPGGEPLGLLVDEVTGMLDPAAEAPLPPPDETEAALPTGWVTSISEHGPGRLVAYLDLSSVLAGDSR
jgi:chemotaxis signal transduction protein